MEDFLEKLMEMSFEAISGVEKMLRMAWEALESAEGEQWGAAMDEELARLREMGMWELTEDMPEECVPIGNRWVFTKKKDEHGNTIWYKAQLVTQGFSQKPGTDYSNNGMFAPVMRFESLCTAFGMAAINGWDMRQMDVKTAYLNSYLEEEIYMLQHSGFDDGTGCVCRLRRSLYGLKQAGNVWNKAWNKAIEELGYEKLKSDYCCFVRCKGEDFSIILVWVDDLINFSNDTDRIERELKTKFEINVIGEPSILLGMKIDRDEEKKTISLSQTHYIDSLLERFSLANANTVLTPMDPNVNLDEEDQGEGEKEKNMDEKGLETYATAIRLLMYAALATRPDIAYAVQRLAQFTKHPRPKHWTAMKQIFRYLKGTRTHALTFGGSDISWTTELTFFCNADWASNTDRKSMSSYIVLFAGGAVAWSVKKQSTIALSMAKAEYIAKQVLWHRTFCEELGFPQLTTSTIFCDNQAAIAIAHHPEFHTRMKHIDIAFHFLRDLVESGTIDIIYVPSRENLVDLFTKGLARPLHMELTYGVGVMLE